VERRAAWSAIAAIAAGLLTPGVVTWFLGFLPPPPLPPAPPPRHPAPAAEVSLSSPDASQMTKPQVVFA
jgi:hypothetical protein